jgi:hypothetical protein
MTSTKPKTLSNHEIVTIAVYLLGGDTKRVETEDTRKNEARLLRRITPVING